ncbi:hypothetical protein GCM10009839_17620 [Catenulispora yoronensis]|uniref:Uncharacterized protein n=1 Tax=Catenulispora yoronensis TaxID=450799 RepID=A0ABP5FBE7_9ACTN
MSNHHRALTRRDRIRLLAATVTGIAQGAVRALLDHLLNIH